MKYFIFQCNDWGRWVFILTKSRYRKSAQAKIRKIATDLKLNNWVFISLKETEISSEWLKSHELDTLYEGQIYSKTNPERKLIIAHA